jgi:NAD(P)-dependent dehydrogenase (short-subunit alcohol dehydrogenase family)
MKEFQDKVAVITGGASGIGRGIAECCVARGMKVVLADIEEAVLYRTADELEAMGTAVLPVVMDVSKAANIEALAQKTLDTFGAVHLLVNNAGVGAGSTAWDSTLADWEWVMGINLWGVIHGVRTFVPIMLAQGDECHIVNTASIAGLLPAGTPAPYHVTKHAVVGLTEHLHSSLVAQNAKIGASVLCPAWVNTKIMDSERNRPTALQNVEEVPLTAEQEAMIEAMRQFVVSGMSPRQVGEIVLAAIEANKLYILTHPDFKTFLQKRLEAIMA